MKIFSSRYFHKLKSIRNSPKLIVFLILIAVFLAAIGYNLSPNLLGEKRESEDTGANDIAKWTSLFYFAGDNNLADYNEMLTNLEFLQRVGSTDEVNLICLLDRNGADDSKVLYIKKGSMDEKPLSEVHPDWTNEVNMGDPDTLTAMAKWTFDTYPAERQLILLSNHGGGWRGLCWDDTSNGDHLDLADLKTSLGELQEYFGRKVDILATEACLVGMIEFAYAVYEYADYYIGSQAYSYGAENTTDGGFVVGNWQYDLMWGALIENPDMTPKEFCKVIIDNFKDYGPWRMVPLVPKTESSDTLSVIESSQVKNVVTAVDKLATALKSVFPIRRERVTGALQTTEQFSGQFDFIGIATYSNIDLWDFADRVMNSIALDDVQAGAKAVKSAVDSAVIYERHGNDVTEGDHVNAHGLSIYFPQRITEYNDKYETIDFTKDTQWDEFIKAYWLIPA
jgi:hypothetical protein